MRFATLAVRLAGAVPPAASGCHGRKAIPSFSQAHLHPPSGADLPYLQARGAPGQPLLVTFDGVIEDRPRTEGSGTEPAAVVRRFIHLWPGETCERNLADASLINTCWRIVSPGAEMVGPVEGHREPHLLLSSESRFRATVGCNQMVGGYHLDGQALSFGAAAATMMACPPPLDDLERRLADTLTRAARWRINAQFLELEDVDGNAIALLQSVYLY